MNAFVRAALCLFITTVVSVYSQTVFSTAPNLNQTEFEGAIYFNGTCITGGTDNEIQRKLPGGFPSILYNVGCGGFNTQSRISIDEEGFLYWLTSSGLLRAHISGASNTTENRGALANSSQLPASSPTAVNNTRFFWAEAVGGEFNENGIVYWAPKAGGGTPTVVYNGSGNSPARGDFIWMHAISDNQVVALTRFGLLMHFRLTTITIPFPTSFWSTSIMETDVQQANVGDDRLWFAVENDVANRVEIRSIAFNDLPSGSSTEHARLASSAKITAIDGDEDNIFVFNKPIGATLGTVLRKRRGTSLFTAPVAIAGPLVNATDMNIAGRKVIWRENYNRTLCIDADADAQTRNLRFARPMEPVQVVQNPEHTVRMIAGKETFVRVYPELASTSVSGETGVFFWPSVILHGEDEDGNPLPGSPMNPMFGSPDFEFIRNPRRENLEEIVMFRLPMDWTEEDIVLRAEINPSRILVESSYTDNTETLAQPFSRRAPVELLFHPLRTTDGLVGDRYLPRYQPMLDRAELLLPSEQLIHWWPNAINIEEYEFPFSFGPYEFTSDPDDDDSWKVLAKLQLRQLLIKPVNLLSPLQIRSSALFVGDHPDRAFNGVAIWDTLINRTTNAGDTFRPAFNSGSSGVTLAHEIGHTFFRLHVDCPVGVPDLIQFYPYNTCNIDDDITGNIGWDSISRMQIDFDDAGDVMSYRNARWMSDYTYGRLTSMFDPLPLRPALGGEKGGVLLGKEWMIYGGWTEGTPEFGFVQPVEGAALLRASDFVDNFDGERGAYKVRGVDASGNEVVTVDVLVALSSEDDKEHGFTALMPVNNSIVRLEFVETANPGTVLASREAGAGVPTVDITAPSAGASPSGSMTVSWNGSDPDGDRVFYTVLLSRDGIDDWQTLIELTLATSIDVDLERLAGDSSSCAIRVVASDGLHCSSDQVGPFTLPDAEPEIYTFYDAGRGRKCDHLGRIVAEAGATIVVSATALDPEDGMILRDDIAWQLTGPVDRNGTGTRWDMADLPPGVYTLRCTATTSSGQTAVDTRTVEVLPKEVPEGTFAPELDGWPDEAAWTFDRRPVSFTYNTGERATVRMVHQGGNLYVGVSGLPKGTNPRQFFGLTFHPNSGGGTSTTSADQRFNFYLDGEIVRSVGNGSGYTNQDTLDGFRARIASNDDFWAIEACIPDSALGGWNGQIVRIGVGHYHRNFSGDDTFWPANGFWNRPVTWGLVRFGEPNPPFLDDDGDSMLDSWERTQFGNLNQDGMGDADGDGRTDVEEFFAGTNPRSSASRLRMSEATVTVSAATGVTIEWNSAAGPTYDLFASSAPSGPYTLLQSGITPTPPRNTFNVPPPLTDLRFFRVATTPTD